MDINLLHPDQKEEKLKHKLKRMIQSPKRFFMDVKCPELALTTIKGIGRCFSNIICKKCDIVMEQCLDISIWDKHWNILQGTDDNLGRVELPMREMDEYDPCKSDYSIPASEGQAEEALALLRSSQAARLEAAVSSRRRLGGTCAGIVDHYSSVAREVRGFPAAEPPAPVPCLVPERPKCPVCLEDAQDGGKEGNDLGDTSKKAGEEKDKQDSKEEKDKDNEKDKPELEADFVDRAENTGVAGVGSKKNKGCQMITLRRCVAWEYPLTRRETFERLLAVYAEELQLADEQHAQHQAGDGRRGEKAEDEAEEEEEEWVLLSQLDMEDPCTSEEACEDVNGTAFFTSDNPDLETLKNPLTAQGPEDNEEQWCFVEAAPTSAGKTAIAEYAIACARREPQRVIDTTPIKTLCNQKFCDLTKRFGSMGSVLNPLSRTLAGKATSTEEEEEAWTFC